MGPRPGGRQAGEPSGSTMLELSWSSIRNTAITVSTSTPDASALMSHDQDPPASPSIASCSPP
jgi:hypothetical protein